MFGVDPTDDQPTRLVFCSRGNFQQVGVFPQSLRLDEAVLASAGVNWQVQEPIATASEWSNGYTYLALEFSGLAITVSALRIVFETRAIIELETTGRQPVAQ